MSKKSFTLFIIVLLGIIAFLGWFFFMRGGDTLLPGDPNQPTDLFPFGPGGTSTNPTNPGQNGTSTGQIDITNEIPRLPRLRQIWRDQTAGATFFPGTGTTTSVRFVDRATGHIYESPLETTGEVKISNVTIPQVYEALWASNGNELIFRYLRSDSMTIQSFYGALATSSASSTMTMEGYFLPANIRDIAVSGDRVLYFNPAVQIGSLIDSRIDGTGRRVAMSSEARDWSLSFTNPKTAFLETRPSGLVKGFGYALNLSTGATTKIAGDILGLTGTINPAANKALMSAQEAGTVVMAGYDIPTAKTTTLSLRTLTDKCVWSTIASEIVYCAVPSNIPSGVYPDDWYKGDVSFSDKIWSIDLSDGQTELVMDPSFEVGQTMDISKLVMSKNDEYLTFTNKKDMSQWLLRIEE